MRPPPRSLRTASCRGFGGAVVVATLALAGCDGCFGPPPTPGPDAGPPDPDAVGLDARPDNTTCTAPARPPVDGAIDVTEPWPNLSLSSPLLMLPEPGTDTLYVIERGGRVVRFNKADGAVVDPEEFGDLSDRVQTTDSGGDERGLLGMAFHPAWPAVAQVFLSYTGFGAGGEPMSDVVSRFTLAADGTIDEDSEQVLLAIPDFAFNHNGGMIAFSPTDPCTTCLYFGTGDGGAGDDPDENGQEPSSLLSKMLRIDVDATDQGAYGIPADNPFVGEAGFAPEVFAWGFRNPWRWSFDRETGDLWVGDVGQNAVEEIDLVTAGANYGWDVLEGNSCHADSAGDDCDAAGFDAPIITYAQTAVRRSVTGGYVSRGPTLSTFAGAYFYADFVSGEVFTHAEGAGPATSPVVALDLPHTIASFAEDNDGELYVIDHERGVIEQLVLSSPAPEESDFPLRLSETGCDDTSSLVPYGPAHSLYSDNATKDRFMGLPAGGAATILEDGDIDFPVGTVFRKDFSVEGERVETRLFVRHDDGDWAGYSYEWNADGTDADLVESAGKLKELRNGQQWAYPSRNACLACHTLAAKRVLGLEIAQLNVGFVYGTGRFANQLKTWEAIGLFDGSLPGALDDLPALPPADAVDAPVEDVARAYLHVNCASCHRPGGTGIGDTDWRFDTAFAAMGLCNAPPTEGDLGVAGAVRLAPGDPALSLVALRMKRLGAGRMPLLGSLVVDDVGTGVIDRWISSLEGCP